MQKLWKALSFARELNKHITFANVRNKLEEHGWDTVIYNTPHGDAYLAKLSRYLPQYAKTTPGFAFRGNISQCICIDGNLSDADRLRVILHEAGHILLGHPVLTEQTLNVPKNPEHEAEANQFARRVMQYRRYTKTGIIAAVCVVAIAVCVGIAVYRQPAETGNAPAIPSAAPYTQGAPDSVYVTKEGDKFHRATCPYIDGKNVLELTLDEAQQMYQPCKYCFSDMQE